MTAAADASNERVDPARWVVPVALALVAAQLGYRAWASYGSWWEGDDFVYIARAFAPGGTSLHAVLQSYAGHLLPADFWATWLVNRVAPYSWPLAATVMVALQLLVSLGMLRLLVVCFGRRWGILPPLVVFLVVSFTIQDSVWWATAIQSLPFKASLVWALAAQVRHAQTRRPLPALVACAWVAFGLLFYEKALLAIGAMALVTVVWFTEGSLRERLVQTWQRYRVSVVANVVLGAAYLLLYVGYGAEFGPGRATEVPIGPTLDVMVLRSWGTGVLGGPLTWSHGLDDPVSYTRPYAVLVVVCWLVLLLLGRELLRSRVGCLRALSVPGYFLVCDVVLVAAGRASTYGPLAGTELRYLTELSVASAIGLGLATMPLLGSIVPVTVRRPSVLLDRPRAAAAATAVVAVLATISTSQYVLTWHHHQPARDIMRRLIADARALPPHTEVVDAVVPEAVLLPIALPDNTTQRLLAPLGLRLRYVTAATDRVRYVAPDGHLGLLGVTAVRHAVRRDDACGYRVGHGTTTVPLNGPLVYGGWWVRLSYVATADSAITVSAGGLTQVTSVKAGVHTLYAAAGDATFREITLGGLVGDATLCTADVTVGRPFAPEER